VRIAIDIGGTFTDFVLFDDVEGYMTAKLPTTAEDPSETVLAGMELLAPGLDRLSFVVHGTTVGLNAFLQRRGERVLLLASSGAGDVYHIARGKRTSKYNVHYRKPQPLVPLRDIVEIGGRIDYSGKEVEPLNEQDVEHAIARAREEGYGAVAVSLLFSYVNGEHEQRIAEMFREALPEVSVSLSHAVVREWREYERTSSTVLDAYVAPTVRRYLTSLERRTQERGLETDIRIMQSNGGIVKAGAARKRAIQTLFSGPVGGAMGGAALAETLNRPNLICVDMGGTSFEVSLITDATPNVEPEMSLEGLPILMSAVNIHTIGAGGGSIAYEEAGGLRVGPRSAAANPGPACYGRGGTEPTVTDANLLLGRIDPEYFLGGDMTLDAEAAERAVSELALKLRIETITLAEGILDVVNLKMAQAIRTLTVERGIEPRDFALVAFGGAGPMHAAFLAQELEIGEVIVPSASPGAFSAWGMLQTPFRHDVSQTYYATADGADLDEIDTRFAELEAEALELLAGDGLDEAAMTTERVIDVRYIGQEHVMQTPLAEVAPTDPDFVAQVADRFHAEHDARHGHANRGAGIEFVALRVVGLGSVDRPESRPPIPTATDGQARRERRARVVFNGGEEETAVLFRQELEPGRPVSGPVIVEEPTTTTIVPPGYRASVEPTGSLILVREAV
jgi:N-methylhydantoinase A